MFVTFLRWINIKVLCLIRNVGYHITFGSDLILCVIIAMNLFSGLIGGPNVTR